MPAVICSVCGFAIPTGGAAAGERVQCPRCTHATRLPPPLPIARPVGAGRAYPSRRPPAGVRPDALFWVAGGTVGGGVLLLLFVMAVMSGRPAVPPGAAVARDKPAALSPPPADTPAAAPQSSGGNQLYERMLGYTVLILNSDGKGLGAGSGAVIDQERGLVVTNYHVVPHDHTAVCQPDFDARGAVVTDPTHYLRSLGALSQPGRVLHRLPDKDLAIVQVPRLSLRTRAVRLATRLASAGDVVYSLGNSGIELDPRAADAGSLWRFTDGRVRVRRQARFPLAVDQFYDGWTLETSAPINPGDSGGPVVNEQGELVAVVSSLRTDKRAVSNNVDLEEVRKLVTVALRR